MYQIWIPVDMRDCSSSPVIFWFGNSFIFDYVLQWVQQSQNIHGTLL